MKNESQAPCQVHPCRKLSRVEAAELLAFARDFHPQARLEKRPHQPWMIVLPPSPEEIALGLARPENESHIELWRCRSCSSVLTEGDIDDERCFFYERTAT